MCLLTHSLYLGLAGELVINKGAKVFLLVYNLNSLVINNNRGDCDLS